MFMQYANIPSVWYSIHLTPFSWLKNQNQYKSGKKSVFQSTAGTGSVAPTSLWRSGCGFTINLMAAVKLAQHQNKHAVIASECFRIFLANKLRWNGNKGEGVCTEQANMSLNNHVFFLWPKEHFWSDVNSVCKTNHLQQWNLNLRNRTQHFDKTDIGQPAMNQK